LSYRDIEELLAERGVQPRLHQITIDDWDGSVFQQQPS